MQQRLKERLVGAAVVVITAVIFIPMILTGPIDSGVITKTNIPERPIENFSSKLIPLTESLNPPSTERYQEDIVDDGSDIRNSAEEETAAVPINTISGIKSEDHFSKLKEATTLSELITEKATSPQTTKKVVPSPRSIKNRQVGLTAWVIQLGSFSSKVNAEKLNLDLRKSGFPAFVEPLTRNNKTTYRVRVGPELLRLDAERLLKKMKTEMKLQGIIVSYP